LLIHLIRYMKVNASRHLTSDPTCLITSGRRT
jgi:hypothetical protein